MAHSRKKRRMDTGHFDLVVVGCGGGHDETNLSGYLFKPKDKPWSVGILGLEAGSGYGALKRLMSTTHPRLFSSLFSSQSMSAMDKAHTVYSHLTGYLLTHAHLDHAASLIISSGSLPGPTKYILGARGVLEDLHQCIWQPGRCWPGIVDWDKSSTANTSGGILRALPVAPAVPTEPSGDRDDEYTPVGLGMDDVLVRIVPVSHGCSSSSPQSDHTQSTDHTDHHTQSAGHTHSDINSPDVYKSSAFFIRHAQSRHEFLFFGDVEADPLSPSTRPLLRPIWQHAAHLFTSKRLHTLLIECSYPAGRAEAQMFGHLSVEGLRREMRALAQEVVRIREKDGRVLKEVVPQSSEALKQAVPQSNEAPRRSRRSKLVHSALFRVGKGAKRKASSDPSPDSSQSTTIQSSDPLHGALTGLRVIVIHCKDPAPGFDLAGAPTIADFIARQLKYGVQGNPELGPDDLGIEYVAAHQGDEYGTSFPVLDE